MRPPARGMAADLTAAASAITFPDSPTRNRTRSTQPASLHTEKPEQQPARSTCSKTTYTQHAAEPSEHATRPDHPNDLPQTNPAQNPAFPKLPAIKHRQPAKPPPTTTTSNAQTVCMEHSARTPMKPHPPPLPPSPGVSPSVPDESTTKGLESARKCPQVPASARKYRKYLKYTERTYLLK